MTKEEVLQGALALNGSDKNYTVTVEDDKIIIEKKYYGTPLRKATFRCIAHLMDDNTYIETAFDNDGYGMQYGSFAKQKKSVSFTFGGKNDAVKVEKEAFDSEDAKKILRVYLEACGYRRANKKSLKLALCIAVPTIVIVLILIAVILALTL